VIDLAVRCHHCGARLTLDDDGREYIVDCRQCVDPEGESPIGWLQGRGSTPETALQHWFERRAELDLEPEVGLSSLSSFVVPKSPEGYVLTTDSLTGAITYGPNLQKASNQ